MQSMRHGFLAGTLAGLLLVLLLFFDQGPSDQLILVAQSLGLDGRGWSKGVAALVVLALAVLIGGLFGVLLRRQAASRARLIFCGLAAGALWWAALYLLLGGVVQRLTFSLYTLMLYLLLSLIYGLVLGNIYATARQRQ